MAVLIVGIVVAFVAGIFSEHSEDVGQVVGDVQQELVGAEAEVDVVHKLLDDVVRLNEERKISFKESNQKMRARFSS